MALIDREFDAFLRLVIRAMKPYLSDIVIVGGCANALYRHHPLATESPIARPGTTDLDVACQTRLILELAGRRATVRLEGNTGGELGCRVHQEQHRPHHELQHTHDFRFPGPGNVPGGMPVCFEIH